MFIMFHHFTVFIIALGSALPLSDYRNNPVQLHFDPDVTSQTGQIEIIDDTNVENSEDFYVTMNVLTNFGEVDPNYERVTVSITDNDGMLNKHLISSL